MLNSFQIFERESRREKIIESKMKEMRLKSKVGKVIDSHLTIKDTAKSAVAFNMDRSNKCKLMINEHK